MTEKIAILWPEIAMFAGTCVVMLVGLSPRAEVRRQTALLAGVTLAVAGLLAANSPGVDGPLPGMMGFVKSLTAAVGLMLVLLLAGTVDRAEERAIAEGRAAFNPLRSTRGEFYSFFLFSLTGVMLCASAGDLIWLFLALELTSLPTYVMVAMSGKGVRLGDRAGEAGVKYFFLGAMGAAVFLYGFALLYGATGTTRFGEMAAFFAAEGVGPMATAGLLLALVGVSFKIAAVPMHFYTADVYQGAAAPVSAFLAFAPKTAGFVSILLLVSAVGWLPTGGRAPALPGSIDAALWLIAALTMTVGNVLALLQTSVKRLLAYSSIAHSGYMLVGVIAGPGDGSFTQNGLSAVLFYLLAYGVTNLGAFAVLACLERDAERGEVDSAADLKGLCRTRPVLGWTMAICLLSLLGFPPLLGFFAKVPLFTSLLGAERYWLLVILALNSAIAAYYYLGLVRVVMLDEPSAESRSVRATPFVSRPVAAVASAVAVVLLAVLGNGLMVASQAAGKYERPAVGERHSARAEAGGSEVGVAESDGRVGR